MTLEFPSSPTNDQVYENYIYNSTVGAWQKLPGNTFADAAISDTPPVNPNNGDLWWNSADGQFYVYYNDGSSAQWVSASMPSVAVSDTPPAGYEGQLWLDSTDGSMYVYYTDPGGASSSWIGAVSRSGGILQVVSTTKTDDFSASVAGGTFTDVTGLSATITPTSTSSKILVFYDIAGASSNTTNLQLSTRMTRGGTAIGVPASAGSRVVANSGMYISSTTNAGISKLSASFLDSPNSTSSLTYQAQVGYADTSAFTIYVNRSRDDTDDGFRHRVASTITLMEVAG